MEPECGVCVGRFAAEGAVPLLLECGHTLCAQCLARVLAQPCPRCPFDNGALKPRALTDFPRNYALIDAMTQRRWQCGAHRRAAELYCADCREGLCECCMETHPPRHALHRVEAHLAATRDFLAEALQRALDLQRRAAAEDEAAALAAERLTEERSILLLLASNFCSNLRAAVDAFEAGLRGAVQRTVEPLAGRLEARRGCQAELRRRFLEQSARRVKELTALAARAENPRAFESRELAEAVEAVRRGALGAFEGATGEGGSSRVDVVQRELGAMRAQFTQQIERCFAADGEDLLLRLRRFESDAAFWAEQRPFLYV